jgi:hypothetical protein
MQKQARSVALRLAFAAAAAVAATAAPALGADLSAGYSGLVVTSEGMVHGVQASLGSGKPGLGFAVDGAYYHADDGAILVGAGPRWSSRPSAGGTRVHVQLLGGVVFAGDGGVFAAPGVGIDFGTNRALGGRLQVDGPFFVGGGVAEVVRVSAGLVWHPGQRRPRAGH